MPASIFNGSAVKILKDILRFKTGKELLSLSSDPTAVDTLAPQGSVGLYGTSLYVKQDAGSTKNWINFRPSDSPLAFLTGATYTTIQEMHNVLNSVGLVSGNGVTDGGAGTVDVGAGTGIIRATDSDVAELLFFDFGSATGLALTDSNVNYIYVEYNAGTPQIVATTSKRSDYNTNILLGVVSREGTEVHISDKTEVRVSNSASLMVRRLLDTLPFATVNGSAPLLGETGTRNVSVAAGAFWEGLTRFTTAAFDSSGADQFDGYFYRDGVGGWTKVTAQSQIDNTQYDDGDGGLATLTAANKYGVHWVYLEQEGHVAIVYGRGDYFIGAALDAKQPSDLPPQLQVHGKLIGKIIIQKSAATFTLIESLTEGGDFQAFVPTDHNQLINLQGGNGTDEFYHDTLAEHDRQILLEKERKVLEAENFRLNVPATIFGLKSGNVTISSETTTPLQGATSLKMEQSGASPNEYFTLDATYEYDVTLQMQIYGTLGFEYSTSFNGASGDQVFRIEFYNGADWTTLSVDEMDIPTGDKYNRRVFNLPATATKIRVGSRIVVASDSHILYLDDIALIGNPLPTAEQVETQEYRLKQITSAMTDVTAEIEVDLTTAEISDTNGKFIEAVDDSANTRTKFVAKLDCKVDFSASSILVTGSHGMAIAINDVIVKRGSYGDAGSANTISGVHTTVELKKGDYITCGPASAADSTGFTTSLFVHSGYSIHINIVAQRSSTNVVFEGAGSDLDWTAYTPTFQGFGTVSAIDMYWRRSGSSMEIQGVFTAGVTTAVEAQMSLASGAAVKTGLAIRSGGEYFRAFAHSSNGGTTLITGDDTFVNFSSIAVFDAGTVNPLLAANGTAIAATTNVISVNISIPIEGWKASDVMYKVPVTNERVNSLSVFGNDSRVITSTTENIPFGSESKNGWVYGADGSAENRYYVQGSGSQVRISGLIVVSGISNPYAFLYKNNVQYKEMTRKYGTVGDINFQYDSEFGEFTEGDTLSVRMVGGSTLTGSDHHRINIIETYAFEGYFLGNMPSTAHVTGGTEYATAETLDGARIYARTWVVPTDVTANDASYITGLPTTLKPFQSTQFFANLWHIMGEANVTSAANIYYDKANGYIGIGLGGAHDVLAGTTFTFKYTK